MGQAVDETKRQLELTREAIAGHLDQVEKRIRAELDWKTRLRRDGPQIAVVLVGVAGLATVAVVARGRFGGRREEKQREELDALRRVNLRDLAVEIRDLRAEVEKMRDGKGKNGQSLWAKLVLGVASSAASAGGRAAAKRLMDQQAEREAASSR